MPRTARAVRSSGWSGVPDRPRSRIEVWILSSLGASTSWAKEPPEQVGRGSAPTLSHRTPVGSNDLRRRQSEDVWGSLGGRALRHRGIGLGREEPTSAPAGPAKASADSTVKPVSILGGWPVDLSAAPREPVPVTDGAGGGDRSCDLHSTDDRVRGQSDRPPLTASDRQRPSRSLWTVSAQRRIVEPSSANRRDTEGWHRWSAQAGLPVASCPSTLPDTCPDVRTSDTLVPLFPFPCRSRSNSSAGACARCRAAGVRRRPVASTSTGCRAGGAFGHAGRGRISQRAVTTRQGGRARR